MVSPAQVVKTKRNFANRYITGEFGNASPSWQTLGEFLNSSYADAYSRDLIHIRNRVANGPTWYNVRADRVADTFHAICKTQPDVDPDSLYFSAMAPTECTILQGEVARCESYTDPIAAHLTLYYSRQPLTMRAALAKDGRVAYGLEARGLIQWATCPRSYAWLMQLLDRYPDHVVEFSCYSKQWGTLAGYNTVFWEVRRY